MFRLLSIMLMPLCVAPTFSQSAPQAITPFDIPFICNNITVTYTERYIEPSDFTVYETINERRINAPLEDKMRLVDDRLRRGADYKSALLYCFPLLARTVDEAAQRIYVKPRDSVLTFQPDSQTPFKITKERDGKALDEQHAYREIYLYLKHRNRSAVVLRQIAVKPTVTKEYNAELTYLKGEFSTDFSQSSDNRKENIRIALKKLNGAVIEDGAALSFNKRVGARSEKNGFKLSKIIVGGRYTEGVGGGVCQVSTTLYNAALRAGLDTSAQNHSIAPSYVKPSFDAMVNSGSSDLVLSNNTGERVFLRCFVQNDRAKVEIYGLKNQYTIVPQSRTLSIKEAPPDEEIIDTDYQYFDSETAVSGQRKQISYAHNGLTSEGYLLYYDSDGRFIKQIKIRRDTYSPVSGVVVVAP